jgi:hypothetical protein
MVDKNAITTITILKTTRDNLSSCMKHNQTYDEFLNEIIKFYPIIQRIKEGEPPNPQNTTT